MGMFKGRWTSGGSTPAPTDPDPSKYNILEQYKVGKFWVYMIVYPNCTNYEGKKCILTDKEIDEKKPFDPHFMENNGVVARFKPTPTGFENAIVMARYLSAKR